MDRVPEFAKSAGFLSLSKPDERTKMEQLYRDAHFLLQPCRAECFGHIFPEANSFALPAIASNTGGIPTAVHEGVNGYCVAVENAAGYAECIARLFSNPGEYRALAMKAFDDYNARLSWQQAAQQVMNILEEL
jgi:glycosyltransferase involved in cell wall biosynthesis